MNTLSGVAEPYATLTLDGLNATSTLIEDAVDDYLPISGGTLVSSTGTTRLGIAASTLGTLEYFTTAGVSQASMYYNIGASELRFTVGTSNNILRLGGTTITFARNISMASTNKITNMAAGTTANDAVNYGQTMLRSGVNAATANIPMGGFKLTGLGLGVAGDDAATVSQLTASPHFYLPLAGGTMSGNLVINRGVNPCILTLASAGNTTIDFKDDNLVLKGSMQYNQPANSLYFDLAGVTRQTISTTAATFSIPVAMSSQKITGLLAGAGGSTDAANVAQMEAADALKLSLTGGTLTGGFTVNTGAVDNLVRVASSNSSAIYFTDLSLTMKAAVLYFEPTNVLDFKLGSTLLQTHSTTHCTFYFPIAMSSKNITGLAAGAAGSTEAANVAQMETADNLRVRHDGSTAMTGSLNMNSNSVNNVVNVRSPTATDLVLGRTGTGTEIQIKATEILIGKNITMSGANINMGTGYIGLQAGVNPTDAVNKGQLDGAGTTLTSAYIAADAVVVASSVQKTGSALTGGLTWSNVATPISAVNTGGPLNVSLSAGTAGVPQTCSMKMASNSQSYTEFTDVAGTTKAWIRYLASGGGSIDLTVANNPMATLTSSTVTLGGTVQLGGNRVTGMGAPTADTDAATRLYVTNADATVVASSVQKNGSTMSGSLNMGGTNRVTNMAASTVDGDAVRRQELYGVFLPLNGGTMGGAINMGAFQITNMANGTGAQNAVTYTQTLLRNGTQAMTGQLYMGNFRIGNLSPGLTSLDAVNYQQIAQSSIPLTAWRSGETMFTVRKSPAFSQNLTNTSCTVATAQVELLSTSMAVIAGNYVVVTATFECSSTGGGGDDHFRIVYEYGTTPQTVTYNYNLGAPTNFRNRVCTQEYCFLVPNTGIRTILARLYNDGDDTMTIDDTNWSFVVRQIQA